MKLFTILFLSCLVSFTSCKKEGGLVSISKENILDSQIDITGVIKDWSYVKLDLQAVGLFSKSIVGARIIGDYAILEAYDEKGKCFLLFEATGKFITKVDKSKLAEEWMEDGLRSSLNPFGKEIVIIDPFNHIGYWFDFEGKLVRQRKYCSNEILSEYYYLSPDQILACNQVTLEYNIAYFTTDTAFQLPKVVAKHDVTWPVGAVPFAHKAVALGKEDAIFMLPLCDTLFSISATGVVPSYVLDVQKNVVIGTETNYMTLCKQLRDQGQDIRQKILQTDRHLWLEYEKNVLIYDKISEKGVFLNKGAKLSSSQMIPPRDLLGNTSESVVSCLTGEELQQWANFLTNEKVAPEKRLNELLTNAAGQECVVLISYQLNNL